MNKAFTNAAAIVLACAGLPGLQLSAFAGDNASATEAPRFSRSAEGRPDASVDRTASLSAAANLEFEALVSEGARVSPGRSARGKIIDVIANAGISSASHDTVDFWFFDAGTELFYDYDRDGYFRGLTVYFDADVSDGVADVYAELYLSRNGGPWNRFFTTRVFSLFGASPDDEYEVVTEFDAGYPSGDYDVLVELYDADTGDFLTDIGPVDDVDLAYLPLEDAGWDSPPVYSGYSHGGGSAGPLALLLLVLLIAWRQRQLDRLRLGATVPVAQGLAEK